MPIQSRGRNIPLQSRGVKMPFPLEGGKYQYNPEELGLVWELCCQSSGTFTELGASHLLRLETDPKGLAAVAYLTVHKAQ